MNQTPFIQIGKALININAIAAVKRTKEGSLLIRLFGSHTIIVKTESADMVWNTLMPFVTQQYSGAPDAVLVDPSDRLNFDIGVGPDKFPGSAKRR